MEAKSSDMRMMEAASLATSVPTSPIEMPTSEIERVGVGVVVRVAEELR